MTETYSPGSRALVTIKRRDGSHIIQAVTVRCRSLSSMAEWYLVESDNGGTMSVDAAQLRPATALDLMVLELNRAEISIDD